MADRKLRYTVSRPVIGGVPQAVLTMSDDVSKPLLLIVHGGPGEPVTPFTDSLSGLEERFVVCLWEQRGAGMSYSGGKTPENMQVSQFVSDAVEVTKLLLKSFNREKLVLMGFSWGSLVGILAASKAPELYCAYIGVGQIADQLSSERDAYGMALDKAREAGDVKSVDFMNKIGPPPYLGKESMKILMKERTILRKYSDNPAGDVKIWDYILKIFSCPYYKLPDKINYFKGIKSAALFSEVLEIKVLDAAPSIMVPVYVMQGMHDMQTRPEYAKRLIERLYTPEKRFFAFENAGHSPLDDAPDEFYKALDSIDGISEPWIRH